MSRPTYLVLMSERASGVFVSPDAIDLLRAAGEAQTLDLYALGEADRPAAFAEAARDASAIVVAPWGGYGLESVNGWLDLAPNLRVLSGTFDNRVEQMLQAPYADIRARGVTIIDTSRSMTPSVAEFSLAMILNLLRDLPDRVELVRKGGWTTEWFDAGPFISGDLAHRRVGLAGFGVINRTLAKLLAPFECDIATYDPFVGDQMLEYAGIARADSLALLAARSEIFVVGIPPTPATLGIISADVIGALPPGALFVLPTRMQVVQQDALWAAAAAGRIRAAVDVFDPEPPPADAPFRTDPNVLVTPHIAGNTQQCHQRCFRTACSEAVAAVEGKAVTYEMSDRDSALYAGRAQPVSNAL